MFIMTSEMLTFASHLLGHVKDLGEDSTQIDKVRIYRTVSQWKPTPHIWASPMRPFFLCNTIDLDTHTDTLILECSSVLPCR